MNALSAPFKQLVERRLWPLAVLLVAALAAVPMLLASEPAPVAPSTSAAPAGGPGADAALAAQPIVTVGDGAARDARRKVLGARKNPFKPEVKAKAATAGDVDVAAPAKPGGQTAGTGGGTSTPTTPVTPVTPIAPAKTYETYSLFVKWGETSSGDLRTRNVPRLKAFPATDFPVVIYLGLLDDLKTAVFLVDHNVTVQGDGRCYPSAGNCQTLHLRKGDIAFLDAESGSSSFQFQLQVKKIVKRKTSDADANQRESAGGRRALRSRLGRIGRLRYDARSGTLRRLSAKAYKAELSRAG